MSRSQFEQSLLDVVSALAAGEGSKDSFCITYKLARKDHANVWKHAIPTPLGFRGELMSILRYDASVASDVAEQIDLGLLDGDEDAYVDGAAVPIFAIGSAARLTPVAGVSGYTAMAPAGAALVITGTSAGTVGTTSYAITIRWYK